MDLTGIFTIGGKPGLQKLVAQSANGVIVESLIDGKRFNAYSSYKISSLEDISIYGVEDDVPLKEIIKGIADKNNYTEIEVPSKDALSTEFKKYIDYDEERVYVSDIKKIFSWYNLLIKTSLLKPEEKKVEAKVEKEKPAITKKKATPKKEK